MNTQNKEVPPFVKRLHEEKEELDNRISKLEAFIVSDNFKAVNNEIQQDLLVRQLAVMIDYSNILRSRMDILITDNAYGNANYA